MAVYFHGNFGLNRSRMSGILKLGLKNPGASDGDLASPFGYGVPFATKYRSWLHKCGLAELRLPIRLTPEGKKVWSKDSSLETEKTLWFLHWQLVKDPERAEAWHYFYYKFLPENKTFDRKDLLEGLTEQLRSHSEKHFGPGSKLTPVIARKIIECYTESYALGSLGVIENSKDGFRRGRSK